MYYDRTRRQSPIFTEVRDTYDIDLQHRFLLGKRQAIVWGLGYRLSHDKTEDSFTVSINPDSRTTNLLSAFAQDEIGLVEDRLRLTLGVKFEHNDFTGFEIQPGARLVWMPHDRHTVWASVSRAVRTPSRAEDDIRIVQQVLPPGQLFQGAPVAVVAAVGNRDFDSEELLAYGLGYRVRPNEWLSLDFAAFYHVYTGLRSLEPGPPFLETSPAPPHLVVPMFAANKLDGETYGIEAVSTWQVTDWWRLRTLYSYLQVQLHRRKSSRDTTSELAEGNDPHHQFSVRSLMDLPGHVEFDVALRYVDSLPNLRIPSYAVFDVRLGWRLTKNLEASIVGQNLLKTRHPEFVPSFIRTPDTEVQHGVYAKLVWRF
jgi:iron complex outermembrane receptor protein